MGTITAHSRIRIAERCAAHTCATATHIRCSDKAGAKLEKAESCGCEVWTEEKFMQLMNEWENRGSSKDDDNEGEEEEEEEEVVKEKAVSKKKAKPAAPVNNDDEGEAEVEGGDDDDELGGGGSWGQEGYDRAALLRRSSSARTGVG